MLKIDVKMDTSQLARELDQIAKKQIRFATAVALTRTAQSCQKALGEEIGKVFDRPTPWVQRSPFIERATKENLAATVGIRDEGDRATPAKYIKEHFTGGARGSKPMEVAMRSMGILAPGWLVVPSTDGVKRDAYGNVSPATVKRIIRELQAGGRRKDKTGSYRLLVVRPGQADRRTRHLAPGIWSVAQVAGQSVMKPVFLFIRRATYRKVIDLPRMAERVVAREFAGHFRRAFESGLRTAR